MRIRERLPNDVRREQILQAALSLAVSNGYRSITRAEIAITAGVADGQINHIFGGMTELRRAVMRSAIQHRHVEIIAQGLADGDEVAKKAPEDLKREALETFL